MDKPIRVVRIIDRLNIGGPAKHVSWLSAGLNERDFETTLITGTVPEGEGDMSYFARDAGVEPVVIKEMSRELGPRDLLVIIRLIGLLWKLRPQIVHTHKAKAGAAGRVAAFVYKWLTPSALLGRPRRCRVVHTFHGHIFHSYYGVWKTRLFVLIESLLGRFATDRIITISEQQRREISGILGIRNPDKFQIVPLGLDVGEAPGTAGGLRSGYGIAPDELLVGIVGRLCEVKNHAMFLQVAALLKDEPATRFVIIGDGHLRAPLERQAEDLGIAGRLIFTGFRKDALALYGELDVVALTSLNEGTPLTLIEAMSCGRAVVATEAGGVVDIVGDRIGEAPPSADGFTIRERGLTAPSRDADGFARALRFLLARPDTRRQMGEQGRAFVRAGLSKERLISDIENLYRQLLNREAECEGGIEVSVKSPGTPANRNSL